MDSSEDLPLKQFFQAHGQTFHSGKVEDIIKDHAPEGVLIINSKLYQGTEGLKKGMQHVLDVFSVGVQVVKSAVFRGKIVYLQWHFTHKEHGKLEGSDTFVVEDGKILAQTVFCPIFDLIAP